MRGLIQIEKIGRVCLGVNNPIIWFFFHLGYLPRPTLGIRAGEFGFSPCSLSSSLIFQHGTLVFLSGFKRNMHRDEQRRCLSADETLVLIEKITEFKPPFSKRDNLLSPETTCRSKDRTTNSRLT